jgi:Fe-S-cluster containining protein
MDFHALPGLKMATQPGTQACTFLGEQGCTVYEDRPAACRYYALGSMGMRRKDTNYVEDVYFVVKEDHCKGHFEPKTQTVAEYRHEQGVDKYDEMNAAWRETIIKKRSAGPTVGAPSERSMQLFDMCSYDVDSFRRFVQSEGFQQVFDLPEDEVRKILDDEDALLLFAMRFLRQVLFGEQTIALKSGAREERIQRRKARMETLRQEADRERRARMDVYKTSEGS